MTAYVGFFANGKLQKMAISGGTPQVLATALAGRGGSWGSKGVIIYAAGRPKSAAAYQCRRHGDGAGHARHQDRGGSIPPLARVSSRRRPFLVLGRELFRNAKDDRLSGIYPVLSKARRESLSFSAIRVLASMPTICTMRMSKGSWSAWLLTHPPPRFRGVRPCRECRRISTLHVLVGFHGRAERDVDLQHRRRGSAVRAYLDRPLGQGTGSYRRSRRRGEPHAFS
jgi:hypothetical protein